MRSRRRGFWAVGILVLSTVVPARAERGAGPVSNDAQAVRTLAETIDRLIAEKWTEAGVQPGSRSEDAEFLRRVSLDLVGRIPSVAETRDFLEDQRPDKRTRLVESLLDGPAYVNHWTSFWRDLLLPEADAGNQLQILVPDFEAWLRQKVVENAGYDTLAREVVSLSLDGPQGRRGVNPFDRRNEKPTPLAYYMAKDAKPENLAAGTARTFLGIRIECAQCHDHPFARWTRDEFWSFAAFFGGIERQGAANNQFGPVREIPDRRELSIPGTERVVQATFLDGGEPQWKFQVGSRVTLADWMTAEENPYFARAGVNRLWAHLFGTGLVDPVDDLSDANPPSHPELLDLLAREFAKHGFDAKFLLRALTASRAYQLTSDATGSSQNDPRLFARMAVKGLTAEQLYDSLIQATGRTPESSGRNPFQAVGPYRTDFLQKFSRRDEKATETQTSILQALLMMNGRLIGESTSLGQGATLGAVADAPFLDTPARIETLFLASLNRKPRPEEVERLVAYIERRKAEPAAPSMDRFQAGVSRLLGRTSVPSNSETRALADVFWALLNSSEFLLNH